MRQIRVRFSACGVQIRLNTGIRQSAKHRFPSGRRICLTGVRIFIQPGQPFDAGCGECPVQAQRVEGLSTVAVP